MQKKQYTFIYSIQKDFIEVNMESENILEAKQVSVAFRIAGNFQKAIYDFDLRTPLIPTN